MNQSTVLAGFFVPEKLNDESTQGPTHRCGALLLSRRNRSRDFWKEVIFYRLHSRGLVGFEFFTQIRGYFD